MPGIWLGFLQAATGDTGVKYVLPEISYNWVLIGFRDMGKAYKEPGRLNKAGSVNTCGAYGQGTSSSADCQRIRNGDPPVGLPPSDVPPGDVVSWGPGQAQPWMKWGADLDMSSLVDHVG